MLTVLVVDDFVALVVIVVAYSSGISWLALVIAIALFGRRAWTAAIARAAGASLRRRRCCHLGCAVQVGRRPRGRRPGDGFAYVRVPGWPVGAGECDRGLPAVSRAAHRRTRSPSKREREGSDLPNARLQQLIHPWSSYVVVPVFALANIGIPISWHFLADAFTSPITLGIIVGYVFGKPIGIAGMSWVVTKISRGSLRPPVGWAAVGGAGTIAGIGFTVSL